MLPEPAYRPEGLITAAVVDIEDLEGLSRRLEGRGDAFVEFRQALRFVEQGDDDGYIHLLLPVIRFVRFITWHQRFPLLYAG